MKECYYILRISQGILDIIIGMLKIIYFKFKEKMISSNKNYWQKHNHPNRNFKWNQTRQDGGPIIYVSIII